MAVGNDAYGAADATGNRYGNLVEADDQRLAVPGQLAWADGERVRGSTDCVRGRSVMVQRFAAFAIDRHIDRAMIERIGNAFASRERVIGRKHAADEGNDGDAVLTVVAQRVDVPPRIAVGVDHPREVRSASRLEAAARPDSAAIGTPGPGCVLPPAKYSPGIFVRAPGR